MIQPLDEVTLLEEIARAPADLAPRQIYADWLLERGDSRGELIALQCARAACTPGEARADELERAEGRLVEAHKWEWLKGLNPVLRSGVLAARLERGFLDQPLILAEPYAAFFEEHRLRLFRLSPVIYVLHEKVPRTSALADLYRAFSASRVTPAGPTRPVAVKLASSLRNSREAAVAEAQLHEEDRLLAGLAGQPGFCATLGIGRCMRSDHPALVRERPDGLTLRELFERPAYERVEVAARVGIMVQLAAALEHLHRAFGCPHGELRSDQAAVDRLGQVKLLELGSALTGREVAPAAPGELLEHGEPFPREAMCESRNDVGRGDAAYRSSFWPPDPGSSEAGDLFSLGLLLCEALLGSRLLGRTELERHRLSRMDVDEASTVVAGWRALLAERAAPAALQRLIVRTLSHDARNRPSSAEVLAELHRIAVEERWELTPARIAPSLSETLSSPAPCRTPVLASEQEERDWAEQHMMLGVPAMPEE